MKKYQNNNSDIIKNIEDQFIKDNIPQIDIGDNIKIKLRIQEGNKERIQISEGVIIAKHNSRLNTTITVRKIIQNIGVERIYLIHSPRILNIEIMRKSKVRRSKLYYLRKRSGKATRLKRKL
uniref:Ribosomal protein L19 n=2 Tax=Membranoptera TaxID=158697 RepID=A0A1L1Y9T3_9FLOR|nr:ribosomal protein L19 [Membranoptera weeksiae]YP_009332855.1 ribosomal protein L19 [Membranoptera tenuis]AHZ94649.1 ribosomal protein L19 [Membranoptera weeksiae]AKL79111.1 ribosomal protein L19 [Membranoptera tenuis]